MPDFSKRSLLPEVMDQPEASEVETKQALHEIDVINNWLGGHGLILNALSKLDWPDDNVTILDLGCGGGGTLRTIATWAQNNKKRVKLIGVDRNKLMTTYAACLSESFSNIEYLTMSVFDPQLLEIRADITMNTLFCHHFTDDELVNLIHIMDRVTSHSIIINDLDRHWFAYYSIKVITALFSKTPMVKYDAPLSVARALTKSEWERILQKANVKNYSLRWKWAWRWQIIIPKTENYVG
jgi:2-polyprenyl-3-methyl-5-hydroxy-6-metoxy-1,4-benzoquinol methylase